MENKQKLNIGNVIRKYLFVLCGAYGCVFSICNTLQFSLQIEKKMLWAAGVIAIMTMGIVLTFQEKKVKISTVIFWTGTAVAAFRYKEKLIHGTKEVVQKLVDLAKTYYGTEAGKWIMQSYSGGDITVGLIVFAVITVVFLAGIWESRKCKAAGYVFLGMIFLLPFSMGSIMKTAGMVLIVACSVGLHNGTEEGSWKKDLAAVLVIAVSLVIGHFVLQKPITGYAENPGALRSDFVKILNSTGKAQGGVGSRVGMHKEIVPGDKIQLRLRAEKIPTTDLYLKGYIGGKYHPQKWSDVNMSGLEKKTGKTVEEIQNSSYEKLEEAMSKLEIEEVDVNRAYAYYPYYSRYEGCSFEGDAYVKGRGENKYTAKYCTLHTLAYMNEEPWEEGYSEFVREHYLDVPENVREELQNAVEATAGDTTEEILDNIRIYLARETDYTLKPGKTPYGEDTVTYFLNENKKGYCVHYATAAAVMLRLHDIPSRFVSGYMVEKKEFKPDGAGVMAEVTGENAHAWAEYYVKGFGWIPLEVTPSYGNGIELSDGENDIQESDTSGTDMPETDEQENSTDDENQNEPDNGNDSVENQSADGRETGQTSGVGNHGMEEPDSVVVRAKIQQAAKWVLTVTGILILILSVFLIRQNARRRKKYGIDRNPNARVRCMFWYFYEMIIDFGFPKDQTVENSGFAEVLCRQFQSVSKEEAVMFMDIIEKANYGNQDINREEVDFIEKIYRKVKLDGMSYISKNRKIWMKIWKFY